MTLKHTPLHQVHSKLGAHFTDFGGWDMPLRYGSELEEHRAVRETAGMFDLSHMGEVWVEGPDAVTYMNTALAGNFAPLAQGRAKYTLLLNSEGGIIDDLIVYRLGETRFLAVPNAGNTPAVVQALQERSHAHDVTITDASDATALIAVQGPAAEAIVAQLTDAAENVRELRYYGAVHLTLAGVPALVARTGYTGEDGFELYIDAAHAEGLWEALMKAGSPHGLTPCGLASRDSLRLEAGMPLYGNELGTSVTPAQANLAPVVSLKKTESFTGRDAIEQATEPARVLVGLKGLGRRAGRSGYPVLGDGTEIGVITSGQPSPTLGYPIALAFIERQYAEPGTQVEVDLRGKPQPYEVVALPFYRRPQ